MLRINDSGRNNLPRPHYGGDGDIDEAFARSRLPLAAASPFGRGFEIGISPDVSELFFYF